MTIRAKHLAAQVAVGLARTEEGRATLARVVSPEGPAPA
jgi:hypothetical protein